MPLLGPKGIGDGTVSMGSQTGPRVHACVNTAPGFAKYASIAWLVFFSWSAGFKDTSRIGNKLCIVGSHYFCMNKCTKADFSFAPGR
jgi:hypothetical protein